MSQSPARRISEAERQQFMAAVKHHDMPTVSAMIADGVHPDSEAQHHSALYVAAAQGDVPMMEVLVASGANPNLVLGIRSKQRTALNKAAGTGSRAAVTWLLEHGANPRITDARRRTSGHVLLGNIPKYLAHPGGDDFIVRTLSRMLDLGLPINQVDAEKRTLLHTAVMGGSAGIPCIELLMDCDAYPFVTDTDGLMPIHLASRGNRIDQLRTLVAKGVSINTADEQGRSPLHLYDNAALGEAIFALGGNPECQDIDGFTPLASRLTKLGTERVTPEVLQLLEHGARVDTEAYDGSTPASIIRIRKLTAVAALIAARDARETMAAITARARAR